MVTFLNAIVEQETAWLVQGRVSWASWLENAVRHGQFGFANTLLIRAQRSEASQVRSYQGWQKLGRQVRRGETGIRILTRGGQPRVVFDIAQTEGPPIEPPPRSDSAHTLRLLIRLAGDLGLWVERNERWTYTGPPERVVRIDPDLDDNAAAVRLAHQLGHWRLHGGVDQADGDAAACHGVRRVEVDSVAYLLLRSFGTPASGIRFPTVASWAGRDARANPYAGTRAVGNRVLGTTAWFTKRLGPPSVAAQAESVAPAVQEPAAVVVDQSDPDEPSTPHSSEVTLNELVALQAEAHRAFQRWSNRGWVPAYLAERGFSVQVQRRWGVGYAPRAWRAMTDHLRRRGYSEEAIVAAGLARRDRDGRLFDTFRDRAVLPIRRADGTVAGFIGRAREGAAEPKYLNSPASELFRKGDLLFGLHEVRDQLTRGTRPVLVEGPLDAIAVNISAPDTHAAVAPCGTAITARQLAALSDDTDLDTCGLLIALDGDEAGQAALLRRWSVLAQISGPLHAALLPKGRDPADILRYQGCMAVREALSNSVSLADLVIDRLIEPAALSCHPEEQLAAVRAAAAALARRPPSEYAEQVARIAIRLNIPPPLITTALMEAISASPPSPGSLARQGFPRPPAPLPGTRSEASDRAAGSSPPSTPGRTR